MTTEPTNKPIYMFMADSRDGWWGGHASIETAIQEAVDCGCEEVLVAPVNPDSLEEGVPVEILGEIRRYQLRDEDDNVLNTPRFVKVQQEADI